MVSDSPTENDLRLTLQFVLLGEIFPAIRAIAFKYDRTKKDLNMKYFLDREPTEEDCESLEAVTGELEAQYRFSDFERTETECIFSAGPIESFDRDLKVVFLRKEKLID